MASHANGFVHDVAAEFQQRWDNDLADLPRLQVIDEKKDFTEEMPDYMKSWALDEAGFNYNMVAVFGSQSTGKSTLLNRLFGTSFDVMNEAQRKQTTKGIWMSRGRGMHVLVMDVEGTDGRERGEDQDFERKSALFSLATSEVIILNLWEHQVGLYQGANLGLLKTVFEVNLQLFQAQKGKEKTLLLFVIRDFVGTTPLSSHQKTLQEELDKIWDGLSKPEGLEECKITDYFDSMYATLPHKILQPGEFDREVAMLRLRFIDPKHPNYVFQPNYHKRVPADGLHIYAGGIWDKIQSNKDLDLPTQQELLAQYRCDEIANTVLAVFTAKLTPLKRPIEAGGIIEDLGQQMLEARDIAVKAFDKDASRYHAEVYKRMRLELIVKANTFLNAYYLGQLKNLHKKAAGLFKTTLQEGIKAPNYDFLTVVEDARNTADNYFFTGAKAIKLAETDWVFEDEHLQLVADYDEVASKARADEVKKMEKSLEKLVQLEVNEPLSLLLNNAKPGLWHNVIHIFHTAMNKGREALLKQAKSFKSSEEELHESIINLERRSWQLLRKKVEEETEDTRLLLKLRARFEEKFRYDDNGLPRVWKPEDDIDSYFQKARDETQKLLLLFATIDLSEDPDFVVSSNDDLDFSTSLTVLAESKQADITQRFKRESDAFYLEAKRSTVVTTAKIPYWVLVLLLVLGWNEALVIITSPVYLILFVVFGSAGYIVYLLNLWGTIERMLRVVLNEAYSIGKTKLLESVDRPKDAIEMKAYGQKSE